MSLAVTKNVNSMFLDNRQQGMIASASSYMIITSTKLLTLRPRDKPISDGAIVISTGTIVACGNLKKLISRYPRHKRIHLENSVLMPGLVNLHTHLELPPLLKAIRAASLPEWVMNLIKAKRGLEDSDYLLAVKQNIETLIHTGTTTVAEICTHNASPGLLKQSGLRAAIFHEVISMNPSSSLPRLSSLVGPSTRLIQTGISPHAPHTVSEHVLREIKRNSLQRHVPLCMHVAESRDEVRFLQGKKSGFDKLYLAARWDRTWAPSAASPFEYLLGLGLLGPRFLAVHAVQAKDKDISIIKKTKTPIAHCPRSNKETGVGRMPLKKFLDAGIIVGLGTDSLASSPSLNMWDEMRYAFSVHRRDGITAREVFELATRGGAKALGMGREIGTLEPGKRADLIAVPLPEKDTGDIYSDLLRETESCIMNIVHGVVLGDGIANNSEF